jgi:hypothetical protein
MSSQMVSASDKMTGSALVSEVLSIPLIIRGKPNTRLLKGHIFGVNLFSGTVIGRMMPTVFRSKPFSKLFSGTIFSRVGMPEIIKSKSKK